MGFGLGTMLGEEALRMGKSDLMTAAAILLGMAPGTGPGQSALRSMRAEPIRSLMGGRLQGFPVTVAEGTVFGMIPAFVALQTSLRGEGAMWLSRPDLPSAVVRQAVADRAMGSPLQVSWVRERQTSIGPVQDQRVMAVEAHQSGNLSQPCLLAFSHPGKCARRGWISLDHRGSRRKELLLLRRPLPPSQGRPGARGNQPQHGQHSPAESHCLHP